jgi:WD40 repeat protein
MPQRATMIACKTGGTAIDIYDATKHPHFATQYLDNNDTSSNDNSPNEHTGHKHKKRKADKDNNADAVEPTAVLVGHEKDGYALAWSPHDHGSIASGSDGDGLVLVWDLGGGGGGEDADEANAHDVSSDMRRGQM